MGQLREKILQSLAKAQEPPPAKQKKTLPPPEDKPRAKRGGKRHRRIKEKYGQTEFKKAVNRVKFGADAEDNIYGEDWGLGVPFFEGKPMALKTMKVSKEKQLQQHMKVVLAVLWLSLQSRVLSWRILTLRAKLP